MANCTTTIMDKQIRRCSGCKQFKPFSDYAKESKRKLGLGYLCKICRGEKSSNRINKNKYRNSLRIEPEDLNKKCAACKQTKSVNEFWKNFSTKDGLTNRCKSCEKERHDIYAQTLNGRFRIYRDRKEKDFALTIEQFDQLTKQSCEYCGGFNKENINGIDRVDSNVGYVLSNCVSCCFICNWMKLNLCKDAFLNHIFRINDFVKNKQKDLSNVTQNESQRIGIQQCTFQLSGSATTI